MSVPHESAQQNTKTNQTQTLENISFQMAKLASTRKTTDTKQTKYIPNRWKHTQTGRNIKEGDG